MNEEQRRDRATSQYRLMGTPRSRPKEPTPLGMLLMMAAVFCGIVGVLALCWAVDVAVRAL